jgi:hypothetical protein
MSKVCVTVDYRSLSVHVVMRNCKASAT